jgi:hypothetical protein
MSTCAAAIQALQDFLENGAVHPIFAMKKYTSAPMQRGLPELYLANIFVLVDGPLARALSTSDTARDKFAAMKDQLKSVQVVSADQLFPTPPDLCARMVRLAGVREGDRVLEPSAGTGNIVKAIQYVGGRPFTVEIDNRLAPITAARCADFLELTPERDGGDHDAVVMNPPFKDGADIKHILHARHFLKSGGRLVAICARGPRQAEKLKPLCEIWEELPEGTFAGTGVRAVLLTMRGPS